MTVLKAKSAYASPVDIEICDPYGPGRVDVSSGRRRLFHPCQRVGLYGVHPTTWPLLRDLPHIGISVLGAHREQAGRRLGARGGHRFVDVPWRSTASGCVLIKDVAAWYDRTVEQRIRSGDHDIVVLRVHDSARRSPFRRPSGKFISRHVSSA